MAELSDSFKTRQTAEFDTLRAGPDWQLRDDVTVPALRTALFCMLVKNSEDTMRINLEHHYQLGFRRFFLMDNNSTDQTRDIIFRFRDTHPEASVCYITDFEHGYFQATKMETLVAFAKIYFSHDAEPPEWAFFVDSDEFIACCTRHTHSAVQAFDTALRDPQAQVLVFNWAQSALWDPAAEKTTQFGPTLTSTTLTIASSMKVYVTKVALRLNSGFLPNTGNHFIREGEVAETHCRDMIGSGFIMLHFPVRTVEQMRRKLEDGVKALDAGRLDPQLGNHWRNYYSLYKQHGETVLHDILREHIALSS